MHIIGDVAGRTCLIVDDMVDTAGTLCKAADALKEHGAARVVAYSTHPVLSGPAIKNIENSNLDSLVVTDTIPLSEEAKKLWPHSPTLDGKATRRIDPPRKQRRIHQRDVRQHLTQVSFCRADNPAPNQQILSHLLNTLTSRSQAS